MATRMKLKINVFLKLKETFILYFSLKYSVLAVIGGRAAIFHSPMKGQRLFKDIFCSLELTILNSDQESLALRIPVFIHLEISLNTLKYALLQHGGL